MSKLRNIILFLFGTHRLRPRPHHSSPNVDPIFLYRQESHHEGATTRPRRAIKRLRRSKKGRGDAALDDSSTDDSFGSANSSSEDVTTPAGSRVESTKSNDSSDEVTSSESDEGNILDGSEDGMDTDWSSTTTTTQPSSTLDPYHHYRQEEGVSEVEPSTTTTQGTPATQRPTFSPSTTPSTIEWYIDPEEGPRLFPPRTFTTTTQPPKSMAEFYNRSPKIPVRHNATSTLRQGQIQHVKKRLPSFSSVVKRRQIPVKYPWPVITPRDWREINGIRVRADRFEKDEYIMEDGKTVKKYESKRWKQFVQEIKLSVDRMAQVTKIHMPLPLPEFIMAMMEEEYD